MAPKINQSLGRILDGWYGRSRPLLPCLRRQYKRKSNFKQHLKIFLTELPSIIFKIVHLFDKQRIAVFKCLIDKRCMWFYSIYIYCYLITILALWWFLVEFNINPFLSKSHCMLPKRFYYFAINTFNLIFIKHMFSSLITTKLLLLVFYAVYCHLFFLKPNITNTR